MRDTGVIAPSLSFLNDPRCPLGVPSGTVRATIRFASTQSGNDTGELPLPCQNWDDTGSGYRYRDPELDDGPCRDVSISTGRRIKATCLGKGATTDLPYDLTPGTDEDAVHAVLTLGGVRYCTTFEDFNGKDGSDGKRFLGKNAPPPAACPMLAATTTTTSTTSTTLGGSASAAFLGVAAAGAICP